MNEQARSGTQLPPRYSAARVAGMLLVLTALATAAALVARVAADADEPTLAESLAAISQSRALYGFGGAARLVSGVTLIAAAWLLLRTWIIRRRLDTPIVPYLLAASGLFTAVSGACAVALAVSTQDAAGAALAVPDSTTETVALLRSLTGKIGFAAAGLALIVAARYQWKAGGTLRRISPASAVIGIAMQLIWIDAAAALHRLSGSAFLLWLVVVGALLAMGTVERRFAAMADR